MPGLQRAAYPFLGLFGDPFISDTSLEGGQSSVGPILLGLRFAEANPGDFLSHFATAAQRAALSSLIGVVQRAEAREKPPSLSSPEFEPFLEGLRGEIAALRPGEVLYQLGGWRGLSGGHAIAFVVTRQVDGRFTFAICNSGDGVNHHEARLEYPKTKYRVALSIPNVPEERMLDRAGLLWLLKPYADPDESHTQHSIYSVYAPWLADPSAPSLLTALKGAPEDPANVFASPQTAGTCFFKGPVRGLRYAMHKLGLDDTHFKQVMAAVRAHAIMRLRDALAGTEPEQDESLMNDARVAGLCVRQAASHMARALSAGRISAAAACRVNGALHDIRECLGVAMDLAERANAQPEVAFSNASFAAVSDGVRAVGGVASPDASKWGGKKLAPPAIPEINPLRIGKGDARSATPVDIAQVLSATASVCSDVDGARTMGSMQGTIASLRTVALITEVVVSRLPPPEPALVLSAMQDSPLPPELRHSALEDASALMRAFMAAAVSIPPDREFETVRFVVMGTLYSTFLSFVYAETTESGFHIARVLQGRVLDMQAFFTVNPVHMTTTDPKVAVLCGPVLRFLAHVRQQPPVFELDMGGQDLVLREDTLTAARDVLRALADHSSIDLSATPPSMSRKMPASTFAKHVHWLVELCGTHSSEFGMLWNAGILMRVAEMPDMRHASDGAVSIHELVGLGEAFARSAVFTIENTGDTESARLTINVCAASLRYLPKWTLSGLDSPLRAALDEVRAGAATEEDVVAANGLPDFGHNLSQEDAERLFSSLTAPYLRIPLVLEFLADNRTGCLFSPSVRATVFAALFELGPLSLHVEDESEPIGQVPLSPATLVTQHGLMLNEMRREPEAVVSPLIRLAREAVRISTGAHETPHVDLILFVVRLATGVLAFGRMATHGLPGSFDAPASEDEALQDCLQRLETCLTEVIAPRMEEWVAQADRAQATDVAARIHAHAALLFRALFDGSPMPGILAKMLGSVEYVATWHSAVPRLLEVAKETSLRVSEVSVVRAAIGAARRSMQTVSAMGELERDAALEQVVARVLGSTSVLQASGWSPVKAKAVMRNEKLDVETMLSLSPYVNRDLHVFCESQPGEERNIWSGLSKETEFTRPVVLSAYAFTCVTASPPASWSWTVVGTTKDSEAVTLDTVEGQLLKPGTTITRSLLQAESQPISELSITFSTDARHVHMCFDSIRLFVPVEDTASSGAPPCVFATSDNALSLNMALGDLAVNARDVELCPDSFVRMPSFAQLFGEEVPRCVTTLALSHVREVRTWSDGTPHNLQRWEGLSGDDVKTWQAESDDFPVLLAGSVRYCSAEYEPVDISSDVADARLGWAASTLGSVLTAEERTNKSEDRYFVRRGWNASLSTHAVLLRALSGREARDKQAWSEVHVRRSMGVVDIFQLSEHARRCVRQHVYTSDVRYSLGSLVPSGNEVEALPAKCIARAAGEFRQTAFESSPTLHISRLVPSRGDVSVVHIPPEHLDGRLPAGLLEGREVWAHPSQSEGGQVLVCLPRKRRSESSPARHLLAIALPSHHRAPDEQGATVFRYQWKGGRVLRAPLIHMDLGAQSAGLQAAIHTLCRLDTLGFILAWGADTVVEGVGDAPALHRVAIPPAVELSIVQDARTAAASNPDRAKIAKIELPRLSTSFVPDTLPDGQVVLMNTDQSGFFLSNRRDQAVLGALSCFPHGVLLESLGREVGLLVASCKVSRQRVKTTPLSSAIVPDRSDPRWFTSQAPRTFFFPIHRTGEFMFPPSLAGMLYLFSCQYLSRHFEQAAQTALACQTDLPLTSAEAWALSQMKSAASDPHPDAVACRLRIAASLHESGAIDTKQIGADLKSLLVKRRHVAAGCRLSQAAEMHLVSLACKEPWVAAHAGALYGQDASSGVIAEATVAREDGGRHFAEMKPDVVSNFGSYMYSISSPGPEGCAGVAEFVRRNLNDDWDKYIGYRKKTTFVALYELLTGRTKAMMAGADVSRSLAMLTLRGVAYKLGAGEGKPGNPLVIALRNVEWDLSREWPSVPSAETRRYARDELDKGSEWWNFIEAIVSRTVDRRVPVGLSFSTLKGSPTEGARGIARHCGAQFEPSDASCAARRAISKHSGDVWCSPLLALAVPADVIVNVDRQSPPTAPAERVVNNLLATVPDDVGRAMLTRMRDDIASLRHDASTAMARSLSGIEAGNAASVCEALETTARALRSLADSDEEASRKLIADAKRGARVDVPGPGSDENDALEFLMACAKQRVELSLPQLMQTTMSTAAMNDLWCSNAHMDANRCDLITESVIAAMLYATRSALAHVCAARAFSLRGGLAAAGEVGPEHRLAAASLAEMLSSRRHYGDGTVYDPRFLVFEFAFGLVLRKRQVEMVTDIVEDARSGRSAVHQAIMGMGKTTVVAPLLSLLLADGERAVTHVVPGPLLPFTRDVLRSRFGLAMPKVLYTVDFSRSVPAGRGICGSIIQKVNVARRSRGIVLATPESVKSMALKVVELGDPFTSTRKSSNVLAVAPIPSCVEIVTEEGSRPPTIEALADGSGGVEIVMRSEKRIKSAGRAYMFAKQGQRLLEAKMLMSIARMREWVKAPDNTYVFHLLKLKSQEDLLSFSMYFQDSVTGPTKHFVDLGVSKQGPSRGPLSEFGALSSLLSLWNQHGMLVLDEVDLIMNPLKSELNFPLGPREPIDLAPLRWEAVLHFFDALSLAALTDVSECERGAREHVRSAAKAAADSAVALEDGAVGSILESVAVGAVDAAVELQTQMKQGAVDKQLRTMPHVVLLDDSFYSTRMRKPLAKWMLVWLDSLNGLEIISADEALSFVLAEGDGLAEATEKLRLAMAERRVGAERSIKMLHLARTWVNSLGPHLLRKRNRVGFGLLSAEDEATLTKEDLDNMPFSRRLVAVPFTGKDRPSSNAEFAHPDVLIGATILAYSYSGMRKEDVRNVVMSLKASMTREGGPVEMRPSSVRFGSWLEAASFHGGEVAEIARSVPPLSLFQPEDEAQLNALWRVVSRSPQVQRFYLVKRVFPQCMRQQTKKLSASGQELGSDMVFKTRVGFSGTPSDLLPVAVRGCRFERGSEGKILSMLSAPTFVDCVHVEDWTVQSLLSSIARADPPYHALIDVGAVVTGMENEEVARYLLETGLRGFDACVFLDRSDRQMVVLRGGKRALPLRDVGVSKERRFTFYDQVHTTGIDIKQAAGARAALTLSKGCTLRDVAQGAWRMRQFGDGQRVVFVVTGEVERMARRATGLEDSAPCMQDTVVQWLLLTELKAARLQAEKLVEQNVGTCFRAPVLRELVRREMAGEACNLSALAVFVEDADTSVSMELGTTAPLRLRVEGLIAALRSKAADTETDQGTNEILRDMLVEAEGLQRRGATEDTSLDREQQQEKENEQELEQDVEKDVVSTSAVATDSAAQERWDVAELGGGGIPSALHPVSGVAFSDADGDVFLAAPDRLLVSGNHTALRYTGSKSRRLKNVVVVLEWGSPMKLAAVTLAEASSLRYHVHNGGGCPPLALRVASSGRLLCCSPSHGLSLGLDTLALRHCLRFFNAERYFSPGEVALVRPMLSDDAAARRRFFLASLGMRRREDQDVASTPVAELLGMGAVSEDEGAALEGAWPCVECGTLNVGKEVLCEVCASPKVNVAEMDVDGDGEVSVAEFRAALRRLRAKTPVIPTRRTAQPAPPRRPLTRKSSSAALNLPVALVRRVAAHVHSARGKANAAAAAAARERAAVSAAKVPPPARVLLTVNVPRHSTVTVEAMETATLGSVLAEIGQKAGVAQPQGLLVKSRLFRDESKSLAECGMRGTLSAMAIAAAASSQSK